MDRGYEMERELESFRKFLKMVGGWWFVVCVMSGEKRRGRGRGEAENLEGCWRRLPSTIPRRYFLAVSTELGLSV
jgi:hypothetical protein